MSGRVAVAGVALSDVGRVDDKGPYELIAQASRRALADAGLTPDDVDALSLHWLRHPAPGRRRRVSGAATALDRPPRRSGERRGR